MKGEGGGGCQAWARVDDPGERAWGAEWVQMLLAQEGLVLAPDIKEAVWSALGSLASAPRDERTISGLAALIQHSRLKAALEPYTLDGPWRRVLDAERDDLDEARAQRYEMEELLPHASAARPVPTYLFRPIDRRPPRPP